MTCPRITHVAIRFQGTIWSMPAPNRHHHVIRLIVGMAGVNHVDARDEDQGFLDASGTYLNRRQALRAATENNQLIRKTFPEDLLFSEDLW